MLLAALLHALVEQQTRVVEGVTCGKSACVHKRKWTSPLMLSGRSRPPPIAGIPFDILVHDSQMNPCHELDEQRR